MIFRQMFDATSGTYTYLLASRPGAEALIIDPVIEKVDRYIQLLNELDLRLVKAVDTHLHADHITGLGALRDRTACITVMGENTKADVVSMRVSDGEQLDIEGVTNTASSLGLTSLTSTAFDTNSSINATLDKLGSAIDTLRSQSSKFGANLSVVETRQDFTKQMISVLQTGAANLTLADTNEEAANVLALQTRQQLSSTALSLASQADQNVLRLF